MNVNIIELQNQKTKICVDPRTKLFLLGVFSIIMVSGQTDVATWALKCILSSVIFFLLLFSNKKKIALIYILIFSISLGINIFLFKYLRGGIGTIIALIAALGVRWFPSMVMAYYMITTTKVNEFIAALQKMNISPKVIIPFSVMFRFFPTIYKEANCIENAMKMRGITIGYFFKNPMIIIEYRVIPLIISVVSIGNDLSAAALTRGLGKTKQRTSISNIKFNRLDYIIFLLGLVVLIVFLIEYLK
ncbi:energy-coupling factor transporter transmembrane protein EcfT [Clostridium sporogenes]|uniref:energy-coupling factor transporter transmembrane component T n=1 Tax=unclassified Clostridium TaxID=2614128 RepID=UPI0013D4E7DA|nr:energy-coupling factor transporter transmembrane protein EcfT [Clostridium sporogenes]NFS26331.1 energy-coupling factor transporter transmembrane protein EcfT [Clostridium sporogenes]